MERSYILCIEDDQSDIELMSYIVSEIRPVTTIKFIKDGQAAIAFIEHPDFAKNPPNMLLMDIKIPRLSGLEVVKRYRDNKNLPQVPVIMLSSSDRQDEILQSYANGANSYVSKPRDLDELRTKLFGIIHYWIEINKI